MLLMLAVSLALAGDSPAPSPRDVEEWTTYYYLRPRPDLALPYLAVIEAEGSKRGHSMSELATRGGVRSFYGRLLAQNPALMDEVAAKLPGLSDGQQAFLREALRRCANDACALVLKTKPLAAPPPAALDPDALDDLWGAFLATGERRYVEQVIGALSVPRVPDDVDRAATMQAARWSLATNAYHHCRVLGILEGAAEAQDGPVRDVLAAIASEARDGRAKTPPSEPKPSGGADECPPRAAPPRAEAWPEGVPRPDLTGFWKEDCTHDFGLQIARAGADQYSISFCGPGGCFEPGTYRPNSPIYGDRAYRVKDAKTMAVLGADGFSTYVRCGDRR
jgi:hypothetical protein